MIGWFGWSGCVLYKIQYIEKMLLEILCGLVVLVSLCCLKFHYNRNVKRNLDILSALRRLPKENDTHWPMTHESPRGVLLAIYCHRRKWIYASHRIFEYTNWIYMTSTKDLRRCYVWGPVFRDVKLNLDKARRILAVRATRIEWLLKLCQSRQCQDVALLIDRFLGPVYVQTRDEID